MKMYFMVGFGLFSLFASSQKRPAEAGLISDNDLYVSTVSDKYYTAGFEFFYRYLNKGDTAVVAKRMTEFRIGQYIFNPRTRMADNINYIDRPFAGYLFAEAGRNYFYQNQTVLKVNAQMGVVGPDSFAEESQKTIHWLFGYKKIRGWQYQIHNTLAAQLGGFYAKGLVKNPGKIDFNLQAEACGGTVKTGAVAGFASRISLHGNLLPLYDSALYDAAAGNKERRRAQRELFFFISPKMVWQFHDATIEGSLFNDDSPKVYPVMPFMFAGEAGFKYRTSKWSFSYSFLFHTKEVKNSPYNLNFYYGSIAVSRFLN